MGSAKKKGAKAIAKKPASPVAKAGVSKKKAVAKKSIAAKAITKGSPAKKTPTKKVAKNVPAKNAATAARRASDAPAATFASAANGVGSVFDSPASVRAALKRGGDGLSEAFDPKNRTHHFTILALTHRERVTLLSLLGGPAGLRRRFPNALALLAQEWAIEGRARDALALYDALVEVDHQETGAYGVALWAVQDDNTHLGIDEKRARTYLDRCVPYGKDLPDIHFNAMFVLLELGDIEGAFEQLTLAVARGFSAETIRTALLTERLCAPVRKDPRFFAALD